MIKLIKSSFHKEANTKEKLLEFIRNATVFSMNSECEKFEKAFAQKQERRFAVYVSSGSAANLVLIQALLNLGRLKKNDTVGFSALTWATNVMPLFQLGLNPLAIDCEMETLNVSPRTLEKHIENINCLFLTNVLGFCDKVQEIQKLCEGKGIMLLEDNCESLGSRTAGKLLGNFSLASTFSFFIGHHISTIEGGMICTDDEELYEMLKLVRAHGWDRNLSPSKREELRSKNSVDDFYARYTFYDLAYNARPSEINGFIGNIQINYWDEIVSKRADNFAKFNSAIQQNEKIISFELSHMDIISNFAVPLICKSEEIFKKYKKKFESAEVEIRPIIAGDITKQPFYKKYSKSDSNCENSLAIHKNGFYFGNNPEMTEEEINQLIKLLNNE